MKLAIQVNSGPYTHQGSDSAYLFAKAAIAKGHEIVRVFFYHDGVNNGTRLTTPPQDDRHVVDRWSLIWSSVLQRPNAAAWWMMARPNAMAKMPPTLHRAFASPGWGSLSRPLSRPTVWWYLEIKI